MLKLKTRKCKFCGKPFLGDEYYKHSFKCSKRKAIREGIHELLENLIESSNVSSKNDNLSTCQKSEGNT